ncbi:uncharacterized protein LOC119658983 isoform X1 [Hermetia illucens]|uniref:uncharacterized protein LOC119658983 isoform X1 n=1 Tax=Hermetia illucens TaxID=343691 RepID=UPI0018CC6038|nr:uncharacterized protein LOC119658983 isoform X1 [Hermetia illucens]
MELSISSYLGVDPALEVLIINLYLMVSLLTDPCVFNIYSDLQLIDALTIKEKNSVVDVITKLFISLIIVIKCTTSYIMLGCQIMSLYPIFYSDMADLLLPLIVVCIFRNIILHTVELFIGIFFCYGEIIPILPCILFISKFTVILLTSCYYAFIVTKFYNMITYQTAEVDFIDNEDIVRNRRMKRLTPRKLEFPLMDNKLVTRSYSDGSIENLSVSELSTVTPTSDLKSKTFRISWRVDSDEEQKG